MVAQLNCTCTQNGCIDKTASRTYKAINGQETSITLHCRRDITIKIDHVNNNSGKMMNEQ